MLTGAAIFGLHWSLDRVRGHPTGGNRTVIVLMASASIAMIGRLRQGFTIFG